MRALARLCPVAALLSTAILSACHRPDTSKQLIVVIVPSQDNPFFKTEADAAAARALSLGYRVRVDAHDDDAYRQDNLIDAAVEKRRLQYSFDKLIVSPEMKEIGIGDIKDDRMARAIAIVVEGYQLPRAPAQSPTPRRWSGFSRIVIAARKQHPLSSHSCS